MFRKGWFTTQEGEVQWLGTLSELLDKMMCKNCQHKTDKVKTCNVHEEKPYEVLHGGMCKNFKTL